MIRTIEMKDVQDVCSIYNHYILHTTVTFEEEPISVAEMKRRILEVTPFYPWLVYEDHGIVIGYAYASRWKQRAAYRHSVELSIYFSQDHLGKGFGKLLYETLIAELRKTDVHAAIGGMALPNEQSKKLHESLDFKYIGVFKEVGYKFHQWIDVEYWEMIFD